MRLDKRGISLVVWLERNYGSLAAAPADHPYVIEFKEKYAQNEKNKKYEKQIRLTTTLDLWNKLEVYSAGLKTTRPELLRSWLEDYQEKLYDIHCPYFKEFKVTKYSYLQVSADLHKTIEYKSNKHGLKEQDIMNRVIHKNLFDSNRHVYLI